MSCLRERADVLWRIAAHKVWSSVGLEGFHRTRGTGLPISGSSLPTNVVIAAANI
jgi:hypothetical protein